MVHDACVLSAAVCLQVRRVGKGVAKKRQMVAAPLLPRERAFHIKVPSLPICLLR